MNLCKKDDDVMEVISVAQYGMYGLLAIQKLEKIMDPVRKATVAKLVPPDPDFSFQPPEFTKGTSKSLLFKPPSLRYFGTTAQETN